MWSFQNLRSITKFNAQGIEIHVLNNNFKMKLSTSQKKKLKDYGHQFVYMGTTIFIFKLLNNLLIIYMKHLLSIL